LTEMVLQPKSFLYYHRRLRLSILHLRLGVSASVGTRVLSTLKAFGYYSGSSSNLLSNMWRTTWIFED